MPKNQPKKIFELSGIGIQMGVTIFLGAYFGKKLDQKYPMDKNWFTIALTLLAVGVAMYNFIRQVNRFKDE